MGRSRVARWLVAVLALTLIGCGDDDSPPAATLDTDRTTTTLSPEDEVEQAYLRSWDVYAEAVLTFDTSKLDEVYDGRALELVLEDVAQLKREGKAVRVDVDHDFEVRLLRTDLAEVLDKYVNHSIEVDPETGEPLEADPNEQVTDEYVLQKLEGAWKVLSIVRP